MKYHIEKNTVQETLAIPLYGRKMCSELYPNLYRDETALRLIDQIDYDFSLLSQKSKSLMQQFGFLEAAMRQREAEFDAALEEKRAAAAKEAESFAQQQRDAARVQADKILSDAKAAAESERQKIVAEANREAVAIAEDAMEKILAAQTAKAYDSFVNAAEEEHHEHD